jgi:glycine cleavage system H protein
MANDSTGAIEFTIDKFIFRFPQNLRYSRDGLWVMQESSVLRIGIADFVQQRNGDIAFATLIPAETNVKAGDEIASIETVKVNFSLPSPASGKVVEINALLQNSPELINLEPYGKGWLVALQPADPEGDLGALMTAEAYSNWARQLAEAEMRS